MSFRCQYDYGEEQENKIRISLKLLDQLSKQCLSSVTSL